MILQKKYPDPTVNYRGGGPIRKNTFHCPNCPPPREIVVPIRRGDEFFCPFCKEKLEGLTPEIFTETRDAFMSAER